MKSYREHVVDIIDSFYSTTQNLKSLQNRQFGKSNLSRSDRNRILVETRDILRWKGRIDWYIRKYLNSPFHKLQPKLLSVLEMGTYEILFDDKIPNYAAINSSVEIAKTKLNRKASGLTNAILRKVGTELVNEKPTKIYDHDWRSFPKWLYDKWIKQLFKKAGFKVSIVRLKGRLWQYVFIFGNKVK